jgi:short-subunit dehydrogenase
MKSLAGKTALVTGAAAGIGRALALRLAKAGVQLHLLDLDEANLLSLADEIKLAGATAAIHVCDLQRPEQIAAALRQVIAAGGVDILINNAGVGYWGPTHEMPAAHWDRVLAINLHAPLQIVRELLPSLLARDEAHIVNMSSMLGLIGGPRAAAYSVSKFGLQGLTESLRAEYGRSKLGVTAVCPGFATTKILESARRAGSRHYKQIHPWLMTTPEHIADRTIAALYRNQPLVVITPLAQLLWLGKRLAPSLFLKLFTTRYRAVKKASVSSSSPIKPLQPISWTSRLTYALSWLGIHVAG